MPKLLNKKYGRLFQLPQVSETSIFLFGPRGTGKTFWLKEHFPGAIFVNLLNSQEYLDLQSNPSRIENRIPKGFQNWIVIDEVQKIPNLLNEVHRLIEDFGYRFILTGSSARKLRKEGVNLLAGRAITCFMHPLLIQEVGEDFDLNKVLHSGLLPMAFSLPESQLYLSSYIETYLREEVIQEGVLRNIAGFSRFLESASFSQGEQINFSEIARDTGIDRRTISQYFDILEDLLLSIRISVFSKKAKRKLASQEKFYFFDCGVFRALRPQGPLDSDAEIDGPALETLVLQHLQGLNNYLNMGYQIFYWRTKNGLEVDFICYGTYGLLAIEVKRKNKISKSDLRGLREFRIDYPMARCFLFYGGKNVEYIEDVTLFPFDLGLKKLPEILKENNSISEGNRLNPV